MLAGCAVATAATRIWTTARRGRSDARTPVGGDELRAPVPS
jgi:hypothetical protein